MPFCAHRGRHNIFQNCFEQRHALVWITACDGVTASGNRIEDAGPGMERMVAGAGMDLRPLEEGFARDR